MTTAHTGWAGWAHSDRVRQELLQLRASCRVLAAATTSSSSSYWLV
jgi:hypothetical protein